MDIAFVGRCGDAEAHGDLARQRGQAEGGAKADDHDWNELQSRVHDLSIRRECNGGEKSDRQ